MASVTDSLTSTPSAGATGPRPLMVVDDAHVTYRVYASGKQSNARDNVFSLKTMRGGRGLQTVPALRGVSFTASEGETIGVIGHNGSGKSTLFRAMTGLIPTAQGTIWAADRPVLLGVNAALMPELSGENNIKLGLLAMGFSPEEAAAQVAPIAAFAELNEFIYHPMRTYSSGMGARLRFAIASAKAHSILLIDEALSVGDRRFKIKSEERIRELRDSAGLVMIVSHSAGSLRDTCERVLWIHKGELRADGDSKEVIDEYVRWTKNPGSVAVGASRTAKTTPRRPAVKTAPPADAADTDASVAATRSTGSGPTTKAIPTPAANPRDTARRERFLSANRDRRRRRTIAISITGGAMILAVGAGAAVSLAANQAERSELTELRAVVSASPLPSPSPTFVLPVIGNFATTTATVLCETADSTVDAQLAWDVSGAAKLFITGAPSEGNPTGTPLLADLGLSTPAQPVPFNCANESSTYTLVAENANGQQVTSTVTVARELPPEPETTEPEVTEPEPTEEAPLPEPEQPAQPEPEQPEQPTTPESPSPSPSTSETPTTPESPDPSLSPTSSPTGDATPATG